MRSPFDSFRYQDRWDGRREQSFSLLNPESSEKEGQEVSSSSVCGLGFSLSGKKMSSLRCLSGSRNKDGTDTTPGGSRDSNIVIYHFSPRKEKGDQGVRI